MVELSPTILNVIPTASLPMSVATSMVVSPLADEFPFDKTTKPSISAWLDELDVIISVLDDELLVPATIALVAIDLVFFRDCGAPLAWTPPMPFVAVPTTNDT